MNLQECKELLKEQDKLTRLSLVTPNSEIIQSRIEYLNDLGADNWYNLSEEEREELIEYSEKLQNQWTPLEKYIEAKDIIERYYTTKSKNDMTNNEIFKERRDYWIKVRDENYEKLTEEI